MKKLEFVGSESKNALVILIFEDSEKNKYSLDLTLNDCGKLTRKISEAAMDTVLEGLDT